MAKFHIKKSSSNNQYYWTLVAANGETVAKCSEFHPQKDTVKKSISWVKANAANAEVQDDT